MAARTQLLRSHAYTMSGTAVPKHNIPPSPVITSTVIVGLIAWRGSAGAVRYSVERNDQGSKEWKSICDRCPTDTDDPWADPHGALGGVHYRVIAWNADGVPSEPSDPR
jgi:mannan endo-1,4-beta-mannosidase